MKVNGYFYKKCVSNTIIYMQIWKKEGLKSSFVCSLGTAESCNKTFKEAKIIMDLLNKQHPANLKLIPYNDNEKLIIRNINKTRKKLNIGLSL